MILVVGPCQIESLDHTLRMAAIVAAVANRLQLPIIFKASFDKANRTSGTSPRGAGLAVAVKAFHTLRERFGLDCLTDIHEPWQAREVADAVTHLQIPALLSRQTDLIEAAAATGRTVNIKKGPGASPESMGHAVAKARNCSAEAVWLTERGTTFGYGDLVVDMRNIAAMKGTLVDAVIFDASHSSQRPGADGYRSGGQRSVMPVLARAAIAAGADGIFVETHDDPDHAMSDGPIAWPADRLYDFLAPLVELHYTVRNLD